MELEKSTVDFSRLCRTCNTESTQMSPLFARDSDGGLRLDDMLMSCTNLKILKSDCFPKLICNDCIDDLKIAYRFKQQCEVTDRYYKGLGLNSNSDYTETVVFKQEERDIDFVELMEDNERSGEEGKNDSSNLFLENSNNGDADYSMDIKGELLSISETTVFMERENHDDNIGLETENLKDPLGNDTSSDVQKNRLICYVCKKSYEAADRLRAHEKTHGKRRFSCRTCDRSYDTSDCLWLHRKTHERPRFACDACGKTFARADSLREHRVAHAAGERRYVCDVCDDAFARRLDLRQHKRAHRDGARRFGCDVCAKSFFHVGKLREHRTTHEAGEEERRRFRCEVCGKSYARERALKAHVRKHEEPGSSVSGSKEDVRNGFEGEASAETGMLEIKPDL